MKLGIMQPYFFPYIGYFSVIANTDKWVVFDVTQYTTKSWMNRNRILHPKQSWQYINVPLHNGSQSLRINEVKIFDSMLCKEKILAQIDHYRKKAPYYRNVFNLVKDTFEELASDSLVELNVLGLKNVCQYLGVTFDFIVLSKEDIELPVITKPGGWALEISTVLGASEYVNPIGGEKLFNHDDFGERGIKLSFLESPDFTYECSQYEFVQNLSIIDVLMWNRPEEICSAF